MARPPELGCFCVASAVRGAQLVPYEVDRSLGHTHTHGRQSQQQIEWRCKEGWSRIASLPSRMAGAESNDHVEAKMATRAA